MNDDPQAIANALALLPIQTLNQLRDVLLPLGTLAPGEIGDWVGQDAPTVVNEVPEGYDGPIVCISDSGVQTHRPANDEELAVMKKDREIETRRAADAVEKVKQRDARLEVIRTEASKNPAFAALVTEMGVLN